MNSTFASSHGRLKLAILLGLPVALLAGGCGNDDAMTLNNAIRAGKGKKDELSRVRAIAKELRPNEKGAFAFYDVQEPDGRPFVAQSKDRLKYDQDYILVGHVAKWPKGLGDGKELFLVDHLEKDFPIGLVLGALGIVGALAGWGLYHRYQHRIKKTVGEVLDPGLPHVAAPPTAHISGGTIDGPAPMAPKGVPSLIVQPGVPLKVSKFPAFHLPFDDSNFIRDPERSMNCTSYTFGRRADIPQFVLNCSYVGREAHFRVTVYEDETAYLEVNPDAKNAVKLTTEDGIPLPLAPNHPHELLHGYVLSIGVEPPPGVEASDKYDFVKLKYHCVPDPTRYTGMYT